MFAMMKKYRINEIFYSLQGEGRWSGRPAIFIRFSGCNLACPFCDTDFKAYTEMTADEIINEISQWGDCHFIVLTGGEPTLQIDFEFIDKLHDAKYYVAMETNGTRDYPWNLDWVTVSPKTAFVPRGEVKVKRADEVKLVFDGEHEITDYGIDASWYYLQPCDTGDKEKNLAIVNGCVKYILNNPKWHLSLQQHKIIGVR